MRMRACKNAWSALGLLLCVPAAMAELTPTPGRVDSRVRVVAYDPEQVVRLRGYVGYQIHLQFAEDEEFVNLASGDAKALDVGVEHQHLMLKPIAERIATNITIITNRRVYHFDYSASSKTPDLARDDVIYSLRYTYPQEEAKRAKEAAERKRAEANASAAAAQRVQNLNYWYCGSSAIRPVRVLDDGVQTRLQFGARAEFPTLYVKNDDDSESLLNFTVEQDEAVVHRVARRFVLRRGGLVGCVENRSFDGAGTRLEAGTVMPGVERHTREVGIR